MTPTPPAKAPWTHRLLIWFFSLLFGLLVFWLIGFALRDIGTWPGPDYTAFERQRLDPQLLEQAESLDLRMGETRREIEQQRERQRVLRESTASSQQTMNQLLEFQRLRLQQETELSAEEQQALAEAEQLFLSNQKRFQELNEQVADLSERLRGLEEERRTLGLRIDELRLPIQKEFEAVWERHELKVAAAKLAVLLPLAAIGLFLFLKWRKSLYSPLIHAYGLAVLVRIGLVMHEYFPTRYFKYILILVSIAVVARILVHLLRSIAFPKRDWLLRQYRESYERFACPVCDYPIRRGPLRYSLWTPRSLKRQPVPTDVATSTDDPYTCPSCGTKLFEECGACHRTRHSLLPACEKCGAEKPLPGAADVEAGKVS